MTKRILIVDDEAGVRLALSEALGRCGYSVGTVQDGNEALQVLNQRSYDLVISDINMPGMDGMSLLRELKKKRSGLPVIIITAFATIDRAVEAMKLGAMDFIQKPFSVEDIAGVVQNVFGRTNGSKIDSLNEEKIQKTTIITHNEKMNRLIELARSVAKSQASVLIQGESGTGKELFARLIHESSDRSQGPLVAVNCAAIPANLLESELFGHEKGAFTGAAYQRIGKFEQANNGTILLDEISEMDMALQAKLLRVLQEFEVDRIGGKKPIKLDIRVIATTNRAMPDMIKDGTFRQDLYYRLNVIPLHLPPLRERAEDIIPLARHFIEKVAGKNQKTVNDLTHEAAEYLQQRQWTGNVRELENIIERAVLISYDDRISIEILTMFEESHASDENTNSVSNLAGISMKDMEKNLIVQTLEKVDGNRTHAAKMLGISIRTLRNKINEYRLRENPEGI